MKSEIFWLQYARNVFLGIVTLFNVSKLRSTPMLHFLSIKVPTSFTAALVPSHVLAEILLPYDFTINWPLILETLEG